MKKLLLFSSLILLALAMMSNQRGRAAAFGPATGAPGESGSTCGQSGCHSAGAFNPSIDVTLLNNGAPIDQYTPGQTYTIGLKINHSGLPGGYGFQMVCLDNGNGNPINNFNDLPTGTGEVLISERQYVEQTSRLPVDSITMTWTAPDKDTGPVTFYVAANAVNGNGSPSGDGSANSGFTFEEASSSSTIDIEEVRVDVFPNPTSDLINISTELIVKHVEILDISGAIQRTSRTNTLDISDLSSGLYIVKILGDNTRIYSELIQKI